MFIYFLLFGLNFNVSYAINILLACALLFEVVFKVLI
jgi:hypothetical protein